MRQADHASQSSWSRQVPYREITAKGLPALSQEPDRIGRLQLRLEKPLEDASTLKDTHHMSNS
jgi:hypothetical protein